MEKIYHKHWEGVFDAAFKRIGDEDIAQDITQEIFISLWENREQLHVERSLAAYLHGAVKYRVINHFRSLAIREEHSTVFASLITDRDMATPDTRLLLHEMNTEVDAALAELPEKMRLVISMSRRQEKSVKEIATELDISVQTVKNHITAGMKILRKNLSYILFLAFLLS
ncbi:RNA polymerase sigma-70 factor [Pedobacter rhizosphaerae]|uniref:RNA polymerase sigma-70 factor, ECF subfamily n=1 Tax=Pedobacter rhizosphaerae TaxID=390241 RepID=A0A1H9MPU4_9SPHI|nr:RNA polymerase sigma-70 factor [Pedobacter rhizosphaerae]SER25611.1 RNA polymerase sigma-70 factor, ECF subfamily [Pedobacter rhizosphaerae]